MLYQHLHESDTLLPSKETIQTVWSEIMANSSIKYFGVFINEELVGSATITIIPNLTRSCRPYGVIENVVTHPSHRRKGIGTKILSSMLKLAWAEHCYKVMLMTGRLNKATFSFYESAGFKQNEKQAFVAKPGNTEQIV